MSKEMREQTNKVKNWEQFLNESINELDSKINTTLDNELKSKYTLIQSINVRDNEIIITLNKGYQAYDYFSLKDIEEKIKLDTLNTVKTLTNERYDVIILTTY
jgi:hypothetical protein